LLRSKNSSTSTVAELVAENLRAKQEQEAAAELAAQQAAEEAAAAELNGTGGSTGNGRSPAKRNGRQSVDISVQNTLNEDIGAMAISGKAAAEEDKAYSENGDATDSNNGDAPTLSVPGESVVSFSPLMASQSSHGALPPISAALPNSSSKDKSASRSTTPGDSASTSSLPSILSQKGPPSGTPALDLEREVSAAQVTLVESESEQASPDKLPPLA
jgi:hypothetical protein